MAIPQSGGLKWQDVISWLVQLPSFHVFVKLF